MGKLNSISIIDAAKQVATLAGGVCGRHFEAPAPLDRYLWRETNIYSLKHFYNSCARFEIMDNREHCPMKVGSVFLNDTSKPWENTENAGILHKVT